MRKISESTMKLLDSYPVLKRCVVKYINEQDDPAYLTDLTAYVRKMNVDEPTMFEWSKEKAADFYSWGHNSRYANVFEPELAWNTEQMVIDILHYLVLNKISDESGFDPAKEEG